MKTPTFPATVTEKGKLQMSESARRALEMWLATLAGKRIVIVAKEEQATRSDQANRYYWACVMQPVEDANVGYTKDEFHELMLAKFATRKHYEIKRVSTGEVVEEYDVPQRSSTMKGRSFYDFVEQVRQFVAEFYGIETEDPNPEYWRQAA